MCKTNSFHHFLFRMLLLSKEHLQVGSQEYQVNNSFVPLPSLRHEMMIIELCKYIRPQSLQIAKSGRPKGLHWHEHRGGGTLPMDRTLPVLANNPKAPRVFQRWGQALPLHHHSLVLSTSVQLNRVQRRVTGLFMWREPSTSSTSATWLSWRSAASTATTWSSGCTPTLLLTGDKRDPWQQAQVQGVQLPYHESARENALRPGLSLCRWGRNRWE